MEDPAQGDDPTPAELASGTDPDPETPDIQPGEGDVPPEDVPVDDEGAEDDLLPPAAQPPRVVPIERLNKTIRDRNGLREQNELLKALLQKQGVDPAAPTGKPQTDPLSNYSPKQVDDAKAILHSILKDEFGMVGELGTQLGALKKQQEQTALNEFTAKDSAQLARALKEFTEFKKSDVEAQIQTWLESGNGQLVSLAKAPYRQVLLAMRDMRARIAAKKGKPAPKPPSGGSSDAPLTPGNPVKRSRPNPSDPSAWEENLAKEALKRISTVKTEE